MIINELIKQKPDSLLARAYRFAEKAHKGQKRKNGEPFINHPLATADTLLKWRLDEKTAAAGLLHDVVEDTSVSAEELKKEFGEEIAFLVEGVTKLSRVKYRGAEAEAENLRKMIIAISQDLRVVFVKLADRLHNMKTLDALQPPKQKRIALETSEIYAPIANRLGMYELSGELQDLAFPFLHPQEAKWLKGVVVEEYEKRKKYLNGFKPLVTEALQKAGLEPFSFDFRAKRYYSLYKKLLAHDMDLSRIYDLVAMRLIFKTVSECYAAMGIIHQHWRPLTGRIKDYIAVPKMNGYRSLHTTIIGPKEKLVEIQLRTQEMHEENEYGLAAHWLYKQNKKEKIEKESFDNKKIAEIFDWVKELRRFQERYKNPETKPEEFLEAMKVDFFKDRIFAVTPRGNVIDLPVGSTPVDFAYHIHSEIGDNCVGAKVNDKFVPLDHELRSGDMVQIISQKNKKPSENWLKFAKTSLAREHIKSSLRAKNNILRPVKLSKTEIRLVAEKKPETKKNISTLFKQSHIPLLSFNSANQPGNNFPIYKIECASTDKTKIEKLLWKLKQIKEVKEISYKIV